MEALIRRIKRALGTEADGDALVDLAANARRAEIYLEWLTADAEPASVPPKPEPRKGRVVDPQATPRTPK